MILNKLTLYIAELSDFSAAVLSNLAVNFELVSFQPDASLKAILQNVDIFWFRLGYKINRDVLDESSRCKYIVTPVTGIDHIDEEWCRQLNITIISLRGETEFLRNIRATAEHTIALTLALYRNICSAVNETSHGNWDRDKFRGHELYGKKAGIIGYGRLGKIVADYFAAFGCEVGYYDIVTSESTANLTIYTSLNDLLKVSDIVTLHVNYSHNNHNFFDAACFLSMKPASILINTSRGGLIDENALLQALNEGCIYGAALDVLYGEPNIENHPLIRYAQNHSNLIITPHIGGNTFESFEKTEHFIAQKLTAAIYG